MKTLFLLSCLLMSADNKKVLFHSNKKFFHPKKIPFTIQNKNSQELIESKKDSLSSEFFTLWNEIAKLEDSLYTMNREQARTAINDHKQKFTNFMFDNANVLNEIFGDQNNSTKSK